VEELDILKIGRHLRISPDIKMVVGRNQAENSFLEKYKNGRWCLKTVDYKGPLALIEGEPSGEELKLACAITAGYSDGAEESNLRVSCEKDGEITEICAAPLGREVMSAWLV
jgi:predicted ribosome quality control (RQC) complex YloA/Tae2 family protein